MGSGQLVTVTFIPQQTFVVEQCVAPGEKGAPAGNMGSGWWCLVRPSVKISGPFWVDSASVRGVHGEILK